jgi:hypothetical protein
MRRFAFLFLVASILCRIAVAQDDGMADVKDDKSYQAQKATQEGAGGGEQRHADEAPLNMPEGATRPQVVGTQESPTKTPVSLRIKDALSDMDVATNPTATEEMRKTIDAEQKIEALSQLLEQAAQSDSKSNKDLPPANTPVYPPKPSNPVRPKPAAPASYDAPDFPETPVSSKIKDALTTMDVAPDTAVREQVQEMSDAEQKIKALSQKSDQAARSDTRTNGKVPPANSPAYLPNPSTPVRPRPAESPNYETPNYVEKAGYRDRWYYKLTAAVAINVFRSMLDQGVPPAPVVQTISTTAKGAPHRIPNEVVIVSENVAEADNLQSQLLAQNVTLSRRETLENIGIVISVFVVPRDVPVPDIVDLLRKQYPGAWIDENNIYRFLDGTRLYPKQKVQWPSQDTQRCAQNLKIGLIDTAVDTSHPALLGQQLVTKRFAGAGVDVRPENHGTALAILLAGSPADPVYSGLLPNSTLYVAEAFESDAKRGSHWTTTELIVRALDWLAGEDVQVINMSFGGPRNLVVELVVHKLMHRGITIVAAAGNGGVDGPPMYPAAQYGVVAVTAVDQRNSLYRSATRGAYIDFAAPGVDIWTAVIPDGSRRYRGRYQSGTSYAAPFVTGMVAVLNSTGHDAYEFLTDNAVDLGAAGKDQEFGWGLVQFPFDCP